MVSFRFASLLTIASLGLFACAKPIASPAAAVAAAVDASIIVRGDYPTHACGCDQDLLDVLVKLDADIEVILGDLDGYKRPEKPCDDIIVAINLAIELIAKIDLDVAVLAAHITLIIDILVKIIVGIVVACGKYGIVICIQLILKLDVCIAALLKAVIVLVPEILAELTIALKVHLSLLVAVKLVLTLGICGL